MAWLGTWKYRTKLTIAATNIDADLTQFPLVVDLSTVAPKVYELLGLNTDKISITESDGETELYMLRIDEATLVVSSPTFVISSSVDTVLYVYYDETHAANNTTLSKPTVPRYTFNIVSLPMDLTEDFTGITPRLADHSPYERPFTISSVTYEAVTGPFGNGTALYSDGTGYATTNTTTGLDQGTDDYVISVWIKPTVYDKLQHIISRWEAAMGWRLSLTADNYVQLEAVSSSYTDYTVVSKNPIKTDGSWIHIKYTDNPSSDYGFLTINGGLAGISEYQKAPVLASGAGRTLDLFRGAIADTTEFFAGYILSVEITKYAQAPTNGRYTQPGYMAVDENIGQVYLQSGGVSNNPTQTIIPDNGSGLMRVQHSNSLKNSTTQTKFGTTSIYANGSSSETLDYDARILTFEDDFTIEQWVYPTGAGSLSISNSNTTNNFDALRMTSATDASVYVDNTAVLTGITFGATQWSHYALVRSGSTLTAYVNGVVQDTATQTGTLCNDSLSLGNDELCGDTGYFGNGYIDDINIWNGHAKYTAAFSKPTVRLSHNGSKIFDDDYVAAWFFSNDHSTSDVGDASGNGVGCNCVNTGSPPGVGFASGMIGVYLTTSHVYYLPEIDLGTEWTIDLLMDRNTFDVDAGYVNLGGNGIVNISGNYVSALVDDDVVCRESSATSAGTVTSVLHDSSSTELYTNGVDDTTAASDTAWGISSQYRLNSGQGFKASNYYLGFIFVSSVKRSAAWTAAMGLNTEDNLITSHSEEGHWLTNYRYRAPIQFTRAHGYHSQHPYMVDISSTAGWNNIDATALFDNGFDNSLSLHISTTETASTMADTGKNAYAVTMGATRSSTYAKFTDDSYYYAGAQSTIITATATDLVFTGDFTIGMDVYPTGTGCLGFAHDDGSTNIFMSLVMESDGDASVYYYDGSLGTVVTGIPISYNEWSHYELVRSGDNLIAFVNGVAEATGTLSGTIGESTASTNFIGSANASDYGNGYLDELYIINGWAAHVGDYDIMPMPVKQVKYPFAITRDDGVTELYVEIETYDPGSELIECHVTAPNWGNDPAATSFFGYIYYGGIPPENNGHINENKYGQGDSIRLESINATDSASVVSGDDLINDPTYTNTITTSGTVNHSTTEFKFNNSSMRINLGKIIFDTNVNHPFQSSPFTIQYWVYFSEVDREQYLYNNYGLATEADCFRHYMNSSNHIVIQPQATGSSITGKITIEVDTWYHICIESDGGANTTLYVNGAWDGYIATGHPGNELNYDTNFGRSVLTNATSTAFNGYLDELYVVIGYQLYGGPFATPTDNFLRPHENVWDPNYVYVNHMNTAVNYTGFTSTMSMSEATRNHYYGQWVGSMTTGDLVDGLCGKAYQLDGVDDYLYIPNVDQPGTDSWEGLTAELVCQYDRVFNSDRSFYGGMQQGGHGIADGWGMHIYEKSGDPAHIYALIYDDGEIEYTIHAGEWNTQWKFMGLAISEGGTGVMYVRYGNEVEPVSDHGTFVSNDANTTWNDNTSSTLTIGWNGQTSKCGPHSGPVSEARLSNIQRSDDWVDLTWLSLYGGATNIKTAEIEEIIFFYEVEETGDEVTADEAIFTYFPDLPTVEVVEPQDYEVYPPDSQYTLYGEVVTVLYLMIVRSVEVQFLFEVTSDLIPPESQPEPDYGSIVTNYYLTVTGSEDGLEDIILPLKSFQASKKSGTPTYLSAVIPYASAYDVIMARSKGDLIITQKITRGSTIISSEEIIETGIENVTSYEGGKRSSTTIVGYRQETYQSKGVIMTGASQKQVINGRIKITVAKPAVLVNPGDVVTIGNDTIVVGNITYKISPTTMSMDLIEN